MARTFTAADLGRLALAVAFLSGGLARAAPEDVLRHETMTLPNGLRVLLLPDHRAPTISVVTWYRVGSADELVGRTGLAHLFEHLMFKGSPHAADGVMDRLVEEAGGWTNAYTDDDMTVYIDVASASALERLLWLEADRIAGLDRTLDQAKVDNQRDVVLNERRESYENRPYGMAGLAIGEALWPAGHPYHAPTIGYPADLEAASIEDVRAFFARHYRPDNALMVVAGDLDMAAVRPLVTRYLGAIPPRPAPERRPEPAEPAPLKGSTVINLEDSVQVPRVYVTWRGAREYTPDEAALDLATDILSGGKSSRLYQRLVVRERLAQDVSSGHNGARFGGVVQIVATAKPGVASDKVLAVLDEEVAALAKSAPSADELERAKNSREAHFIGALADLATRAETLAEYAVIAGDENYLPRDLARYRAVTAEEVRDAVARWLRDRGRVVLTVSPRSTHAK